MDEIRNIEELEERLSRPTDAAIEALEKIPGDLVLLGVGGKMGASLAGMAKRACAARGDTRRIIGVSRFGDPRVREQFAEWGVETIAGDLADRRFVQSLPEAASVVFMTGMKFGSTGQEPLTWAMNAYVPALVCEKYAGSRIAAFSTGNVYGLVPHDSGGSVESDPLHPVGEYAMSCLGRERMFEYFCDRDRTPVSILRLNYSTELRYGVIIDLAQKVHSGEPIDLSMGYVNVIWQGDACALTLCALADCAVPARIVNIAGPEMLRVKDVCEQIGALLGKSPVFTGREADDALLNNGSAAHSRYAAPSIKIDQILEWSAAWVANGGETLDKPTHFESREGKF